MNLQTLRASFLIAATSLTTACSMLSSVGLGSSSPSSSSSSPATASSSPSSAPTAPEQAAVPFVDQDEGAWGLQAAHDGQIVFSTVELTKDQNNEKQLITSTTLAKPLFVRAFIPKTLAHMLHDKKPSLSCLQDGGYVGPRKARYEFLVELEGAKPEAHDARGSLGNRWLQHAEARAVRSLAANEGSLVPQKLVEIDEGFDHDPGRYRFLAVASMMKPGKNTLLFTVRIGCSNDYDDIKLVVATGTLEIDVKPADLAALSRKAVKLRPSLDPAMQAKLRSGFERSLRKTDSVVSFAADKPVVEGTYRRWANIRAILRHGNGQCGWAYGFYEDDNHQSSGKYVLKGEHAMPCPN